MTKRVLALPLFTIIMFIVYNIVMGSLGTFLTDWTNDVLFGEIVPNVVNSLIISVGAAEWIKSLILDGTIGGVRTVLGFVPQIAILFLLLSILEDSG